MQPGLRTAAVQPGLRTAAVQEGVCPRGVTAKGPGFSPPGVAVTFVLDKKLLDAPGFFPADLLGPTSTL